MGWQIEHIRGTIDRKLRRIDIDVVISKTRIFMDLQFIHRNDPVIIFIVFFCYRRNFSYFCLF